MGVCHVWCCMHVGVAQFSVLIQNTKKVPLLQDAVYIDLAGSHAHVEEGPSKLVMSLMETQYPLDAKIKQASVTLLQVFLYVHVCVMKLVYCACLHIRVVYSTY